jgi:hypothetical protein
VARMHAIVEEHEAEYLERLKASQAEITKQSM